MLRFIFGKIIHKKWMVFSLMIGGILMISIACCNPMYTNAALQKLFTSSFENAYERTGDYMLSVGAEKIVTLNTGDSKAKSDTVNEKIDEELKDIDAKILMDKRVYSSVGSPCTSDKKTEESNKTYITATMNMEDMEDHITILTGDMYGDEPDENDAYDVIVSRTTYNNMDLSLGEVLSLEYIGYGDTKEPVKLKIVGIFGEKDGDDSLYWNDATPNDYPYQCFLSDKAIVDLQDRIFTKGENGKPGVAGSIKLNRYVYYDAADMDYKNAGELVKISNALAKKSITANFGDICNNYLESEKKIEATMSILQVPTLVLLAIFMYMVSAQMLNMESNEIAMLKSRGVSRLQVIMVYFIQSIMLATVSFIIGIPLGYILCRLLGGSNAFMEFVSRESLPISITGTSLMYGLAAAGFSVLVMTLPVIPLSKTTIVEFKQKSKKHKAFWKKFYLDIILLGVSIYGWYNFSQQKDVIVSKVAKGDSLDPLLFLSSSLFIMCCGMLSIRIIPVIVSIVYKIGKKYWGVAVNTAFLQIIRTREKQEFIMVFLVITVAYGIFNANTARTINVNEEQRIWNNNGADVVIAETWDTNMASVKRAMDLGDNSVELIYKEPDQWKYDEIKEKSKSMTKVYRSNSIKAYAEGKEDKVMENVLLMGINTKEFGETAYIQDGLLDQHWYNYLNLISQDINGILVSTNMKKDMKLEIGDTIEYVRYDELDRKTDTCSGVIYGFVDYWPSYEDTVQVENSAGIMSNMDNYLIVASYDKVINSYDTVPYEWWIKTDKDTNYIYDFIENNSIKLDRFLDSNNDIVIMKNDPVFQETNGMLTISFIVVLVLCMVGFLIYWIISIKQRELMFGIYRAMGLSMKEIIKMLMFEHLFSSVASIAVGVLVGVLSSQLFIPLIELAYATKVAKVDVVSSWLDMTRLGVAIVFILVLCIYVLGKILNNMKISQALKLGEE